MRVVITGANRGIGLALARRYLARGDEVNAGVRAPERDGDLGALAGLHGERLRIAACDVTREESVRAFASAVPTPVDVLIHNAGTRSRPDDLATLDFDDAVRTFQVNALGALRATIAFLPHLRAARGAKVVSVGSALGSITGNTSGGAYGYRMSKAALAMATRSLAHDLRGDGIVAVVVSPGWVRTDMGGPDAPLSAEASAERLVEIVEGLDARDSGAFLDVGGGHLAW